MTSHLNNISSQGGENPLAASAPRPLPRRRCAAARNGALPSPAAFEAPLPRPGLAATQTPRPDRVWPNAHPPGAQEAISPVAQK
jgi:hypothetical protein